MKSSNHINIIILRILSFSWVFISYFGIYAQSDASHLVFKVQGKEVAYPRLSADGKKILYQSNQNGNWQLYFLDLVTGDFVPVIKDRFNDNFPDWSYDNQWIAFVSDRDGNEEIYLMQTDGSNLKRITNDTARDIHPYFSPDGRYILFNSTRGNGSFDIYRYNISSGVVVRLSESTDDETCARFSPDMSQIVYLRNGATSDDVFIADTLNLYPKNITNTPLVRDGWPMFSYDNNWIYYSSMEKGTYCIYRMKKDGSSKSQLTYAIDGEEDARVSVSRDGNTIVYNKSVGNTIELREMELRQ